MRVTVISLILSLGMCGIASAQFVVGMETMPPGSVLPAHTHPHQEEVCPWGREGPRRRFMSPMIILDQRPPS